MTAKEKHELLEKISIEYISRFMNIDVKKELVDLDIPTLTAIYCEAKKTLENNMFFTMEDEETTNKKVNDKLKLLLKLIISKLAMKETRLFIVYSNVTGLPEIQDDGILSVFTKEEFAKDVLSFLTENMLKDCFLVEIENDDKLPFFTKIFYTMGIKQIVLDNGWQNLFIKKEDIIVLNEQMTSNPKLFNAAIRFAQELGWMVTYEEKDENLEKLEKEYYEEINKAQFLVPVIITEDGMAIPSMKMEGEVVHIPLFTDMLEIEAFLGKDISNYKIKIFTVNDLDLDKKYILNPVALGLPILGYKIKETMEVK